jgi:Carboxypeptidase regulatory-like domain
MKVRLASTLLLLGCAAVFSGALFGQRADRASITGLVMDPTGATVPGAAVKIRNESTGVEDVLTTNTAGIYSSPLLALGTYTVTVEQAGFKSFVRPGIILTGGLVYRQDATLEVGDVTERVEVIAAAEMINTSQPEVQHTVNQKYYENLPVVMGGDIRLAESLLMLQPGYFPMRPNGDPMFRGSQFSSRMNGGQTFGAENFYDGAAFGYASGHQQSHESSPSIETVSEMKVTDTTYSAQYGHTTGGVIEYTSKSGTNDLHGSLYEYFANDALNARGFFPAKPTKQRSNAFGFTVGGPVVIPGVYDGHNKTFFFLNLDWLKFRSGALPGFGNTTPIDAFKQGDFSALLTSTQAGVDAQGRTLFNGQIFDPASTSQFNGVNTRDPFPNNVIPAGHPLRSNVAAQIVPLMVRPDRPGTDFNVAGNPAGDQTWQANYITPLIKVDHHFNPSFRTSTTFFWPHRPAIRNCGEVGGCNVQNTTDLSKNTDYIGNGFYQRIATHHITQQFDTIISNNLLHHAMVSYDRWFMGGSSLSAGAGWKEKLWGPSLGGFVDDSGGLPGITFSGNTPYTQLGLNWIGFGFEAINRWQFANDLTWVTGKHTIKVGYEFRHHQFNYRGWANGTNGLMNFSRLGTGGYDDKGNTLSNTGDPFASFLLGQVNSSNFIIPTFTTFNGNWHSVFINDDFKVTNNLTLTLGLRFDYQTPWTNRFDDMSTIDTTAPNPGAGGYPGALVFAGDGPGRLGVKNFDTQIPKDAWGPRFGFAYRLGDKSVIRGGYGIYYNSVAFGVGGQPTLGFTGNSDAPNNTNGLKPVFQLDDGFPADKIRRPPFIDPSFANGTSPTVYPQDGLTLPRYQNWSLTFQHQLQDNLVVDVSYIGNRGTRLPAEWTYLGTAANMNNPSVLGLGSAVLGADINSDTARNAGISPPYSGFTGNVAQALRPWPQYQNLVYRDSPVGQSIYHSVQVKVDKRFSNGLQFRAFYTWSRLNNDGAENAQAAGGIQNPIDVQRGEWGLSADDVPHVVSFSYTYELPIGRNLTGAAAKLLQGWTLNGVLRYESARPLSITMANDLGGLLFNSLKRPNRAGAEGRINTSDFDPNAERTVDKAGWTDPGALQFGDAARADGTARGWPNFVEDVSLFKDTKFMERWTMRFEAQFGNVFNRTVFCDGNSNWSAGSFGQVSTQCNTPRSIQFGMKLIY